MLILTPNEPIHFCFKDGGYAKSVAVVEKASKLHDLKFNPDSALLFLRCGDDIRDKRLEHNQTWRIVLQDQSERNTVYVTAFFDGGKLTLGFDAPDEVRILRESIINKADGSPLWDKR